MFTRSSGFEIITEVQPVDPFAPDETSPPGQATESPATLAIEVDPVPPAICLESEIDQQACNEELGRQIAFTRALNEGHDQVTHRLLAEARVDGGDSEHQWFKQQRRRHAFVRSLSNQNWSAADAILANLKACGRTEERRTLWDMRTNRVYQGYRLAAISHAEASPREPDAFIETVGQSAMDALAARGLRVEVTDQGTFLHADDGHGLIQGHLTRHYSRTLGKNDTVPMSRGVHVIAEVAPQPQTSAMPLFKCVVNAWRQLTRRQSEDAESTTNIVPLYRQVLNVTVERGYGKNELPEVSAADIALDIHKGAKILGCFVLTVQ